MKMFTDLNHILSALHQAGRLHNATRGSVLVYLIVLILIFGILGVTMVSLFTTASTSSATPNDARRAYNIAESGTRYAFSELRDNDFDAATFNALNSTTYNVTDAGSFSLRAFSLWFESSSIQSSSPYTLNIPKGILPLDFDVPDNSNVWIINFEYLEADTDNLGARSPVTTYTRIDDTTARFNISGGFYVSTGESVSLGVMPATTQGSLAAGADLYVERVAKNFFPRFMGVININRVTYSYDRLVDEPANNRVKLEHLTASRFNNTITEFPLTVTKTTGGNYTGDFIVLSPGNHMVIPTGTSESVSYGGDYGDGMNIYDTSPPPPRPDIDADEFTSNLTENETSSGLISVDTVADTLNIGGGVIAGENAEFGAGWYNANKLIGGTNNACQAGACGFRQGIRVFFVLKFLNGQQGDGFTFTLMNATGNDVSSVGGDIELSELMGYAGDSRLDVAGTSFLDGAGEGLQPPKLAVEFDTRTNFDATFESDPEPKDFCIDLSMLKPNTRNDPLSDNRDAVQYVFWGAADSLNILCRDNSPLYDDNRHYDPEDGVPEPINFRDEERTLDKILTSGELGPLDIENTNDWLNGDSLNSKPWAVRLEVERNRINSENFSYELSLWMRQCADTDCSNIIGTLFETTRNTDYNVAFDGTAGLPKLPMTQNFELNEVDPPFNANDPYPIFQKFLFGFTGAAGSEALNAEISKFQLSFIRSGDQIVTDDPDWTP